MKQIFLVILMAAVLCSCQQKKQYFTSGPEIDMAKKGNEAYVKGDWETLRSLYADTAKILVNKWFGEEMSIDQFLMMQKMEVAELASYSIGDDAIYEMVVQDNGDHWVHVWLNWSAKLKNGKEVHTPVHLALQVENGKVVFQGLIFNQLGGYLAAMAPPDSTVMK